MKKKKTKGETIIKRMKLIEVYLVGKPAMKMESIREALKLSRWQCSSALQALRRGRKVGIKIVRPPKISSSVYSSKTYWAIPWEEK